MAVLLESARWQALVPCRAVLGSALSLSECGAGGGRVMARRMRSTAAGEDSGVEGNATGRAVGEAARREETGDAAWPLSTTEMFTRPVEELIEMLEPPFKVVGTRRPGHLSFFHWDLNVSFILDHLNPNLYLTFEDARGRVLGPVGYRGSMHTAGMKIEMGTRMSLGEFRPPIAGVPPLPQIPSRLAVDEGRDFGLSLSGVGFTSGRFRVSAPSAFAGAVVSYRGLGNALGYTRLRTGAHESAFVRMPLLYRPSASERMFLGLFVALYVLGWLAVLSMAGVEFYVALQGVGEAGDGAGDDARTSDARKDTNS